MINKEKAKDLFVNDSNCAQSVLTVLGQNYGLDDRLAYKLSSGLGGGIGYQSGVCGAVLGAFMILGLEYGNQIPEDAESKQLTRKATDLFAEKFRGRFGSIECPGLLGIDIRDTKALEEGRKSNLFNTECPKFVQAAIDIIEEVKSEINEAGSLEYFEDISEDWDKMRQEFFTEEIRKKAFAKAEISKGLTAVDLGAGSGYITEGLLNYDVNIIAIDQSQSMLDIIKKKFNDRSNIKYLVGNSDALPLDDESVDYVFCNMYLHHVSAPQKAISEIYRVLKPGGKILISDLYKHDDKFLILEQYDRWLGFNEYDIKKWYSLAGFKSIKLESIDEKCTSDSKYNCSDQASIEIFLAQGMK